jgi:sugar lactone lactonase YvrE
MCDGSQRGGEMTGTRKSKWYKIISCLLICLFLYQSEYLLCSKNGSEMHEEFKKAKEAYIKGENSKDKLQYEMAKRILERLILCFDKKNEEQKQLLAKVFLLLGASYENLGKIKEAVKNYTKCKKISKTIYKPGSERDDRIITREKRDKKCMCIQIEGISFDHLEHYNNICFKKPKPKIPWLWVAAGVGAAVVIYVLIKSMKKKEYTLIVTVGDGIDGTPTSGSYTYKKGTTVNYNYTTPGGTDLVVLIDGNQASASGTITMDNNHSLTASTTRLHLESKPSGANVFVDNQDRGVITPCDLYIAPGSHEIKLVKDKAGEAKATFTFENNQSYSKTATLAGYTYNFVTTWGSQGGGSGQFSEPKGIGVNDNRHVYVADTGNNRIQKFSINGGFLTEWGKDGTTVGKFNNPMGIAVNNSYVYVADTANKRIQKFDPDGRFLGEWGEKGVDEGEFEAPVGIAIDRDNFVYVADHKLHIIQKFNSNGRNPVRGGTGQLLQPHGIALDKSGYIYVSEYGNHRVRKFEPNFASDVTWGSIGSENGQFRRPRGIAVDESDNVYVADYNNHRIQKFAPDGTFLTTWGSPGSNNGQFNNPYDIAIDRDDYVYVADTKNHRIQKFEMTNQTDGDGVWEDINTANAAFTPTSIPTKKNRFPSVRKKIRPVPDFFKKSKQMRK